MLVQRTLTALAAAAVMLAGAAWGAEEAPTQWTGANDPEMVAASERAQATLPVFWRVYDRQSADKGSYYLVKAPFRTSHGGEEHLWMVVLGKQGDQISGIVVNEPDDVPSVHVKDRVVVAASKVSDWSYDKDGRKYGNFTTRVMVTRMNKVDAADYGAELSESPLEPGDR